MRLFSTVLFSFTAACVFAVPAEAWAQCDADGDGHNAIVCGGDDCDDADANRYPGNVEICDATGHDEDCDFYTPGFRDQDGDSFNSDACFNVNSAGLRVNQGSDCNDQNPSVHFIAAEQCNGRDDNCDGQVDEGVKSKVYLDADGDGFGTGLSLLLYPNLNYATQSGDCDDTNAAIMPGSQVCNGADVMVCSFSGSYAKASCAARSRCHSQPNGTGVCECRRGMRANGTCR